MGTDDVPVLPALGVATNVAQFLTPTGVEHGMLLEMYVNQGERGIVFAVSAPGVIVLKQAIEEYERGLRDVLAGTRDAVVLHAEGE
jgi:hypothetical protein